MVNYWILFLIALSLFSCSELETGPDNLLGIAKMADSVAVRVVVNSDGHGTVTLSPDSGFALNDTIDISSIPDSGYHIDSVLVNGMLIGNDTLLELLLNSDTSLIRVVFAVDSAVNDSSGDTTEVTRDSSTITLKRMLGDTALSEQSFRGVKDSSYTLVLTVEGQLQLDSISVDDTFNVVSAQNDTSYELSLSDTIHVVIAYYSTIEDTSADTGSMKLIPSTGETFTMGMGSDTLVNTFSYDYYMEIVEVTQGLYDSIMNAAFPGSYSSPDWSKAGSGINKPAYNVNWYDAILFCNARSIADGFTPAYSVGTITGTPGNDCRISSVELIDTANGYRLPTEAEWEYACRGGYEYDFFWGDDTTTATVGTYAVYKGVKGSDYTVNQVGGEEPNPFGLYDMNGNVWEWCFDWFGYWGSSPETDYTGASSGDTRIYRGGAYNSPVGELYSGYRNMTAPDIANAYNGFRCVRTKQ